MLTTPRFIALTLTAISLQAADSLQMLIDQAAPKSEVVVRKGTWKEPIRISKPLTLRGAEGAVIDVTADEPAIQIDSREEVALEGITIHWRRATSARSGNPQAALFVKDSGVNLHKVRFIAPDNHARCPSALIASGFSKLAIADCEFQGYDFTIQFGEGSEGTIADSVVSKPGHCGITAGPNSAVNVTGTIVHGSDFHAMRCTGGELNASNNLVIANKNRGFYLGNKPAKGKIQNNLIRDNGTGISGFATSEVEISNNFIANCDFAGIDMRDSSRLKIDRNIIFGNGRGMALFKESGTNRNLIGQNAGGENKVESEGFENAPEMVKVEAKAAASDAGFFEAKDGFGLNDAQRIRTLWSRWRELQKKQAAEK